MEILIRYWFKLLRNQHSRLPLFLFFALLFTTTTRSQNPNSIFRDFDKEMANYKLGSTDTGLLKTVQSLVPDWVTTPFPEQADTLFILGISDPGLVDSIAHHQAVSRALALGALAYSTGCEQFTDYYNRESGSGSNSKYEEIYRFSTDFSSGFSNFKVLNDTMLPSTEEILRLKIPMKDLKETLVKPDRVEALLYNNEDNIIHGNNMARKVSITIQKKDSNEKVIYDASSFYQLNGKATGMKCLSQKSQFVYNHYEFYYTTIDSTPVADTSDFYETTCKQGLWIAYISQILDHLSMQSKLLNKVSQSMRDKTEDTLNELLREKSRTKFTWRIKDLIIHDDKMKVNMTVLKL